jgi:hypothetical protein
MEQVANPLTSLIYVMAKTNHAVALQRFSLKTRIYCIRLKMGFHKDSKLFVKNILPLHVREASSA